MAEERIQIAIRLLPGDLFDGERAVVGDRDLEPHAAVRLRPVQDRFDARATSSTSFMPRSLAQSGWSS